MHNKPLQNRLDQSAGFLLSLTSRKLSHLFMHRLKEFKVTPEQWLVLSCIREQEGIIQKEIALRSGKDRPTITRILDVLDNKKLILKQADPQDRRSYLVYTTEKGRMLLEQTEGIEQHAIIQATDGISHADLERLFTILHRIRENTDKLIQLEQER